MTSALTAFLAASLLDPQHLIDTVGLIGILVIVFAECGLLVGFFLPGDSLLFTAGLLVASGRLNTPIVVLCVLISIAAIAGNLVGYEIGRSLGPAVFRRPDSRLFRQEYVEHTQAFFDKYGGRAILLARFVPIIRTFITVMAGVGKMDRRTYTLYSIVGGVLWGTGVTLLGFWLGRIEFVKNNLEFILIGVVLVSVLPILAKVLQTRRSPGAGQPSDQDA